MNKDDLRKHIQLFQDTEEIVKLLNEKFGVNIINSGLSKPNFYNNYNLLIHNLLVSIFGDLNTDLIEEFCFGQLDISFDELCNRINLA